MARPRTLNDINVVKPIIDEYMKNPKPTLAGLARALNIHYDTLSRNMDREDDIGDILVDAYYYFVQKHEEGLYDKACTGHIFALHCLKKFMTFKENKDEPKDINNNVNFTYEIIDKKKE